MLQRFYITKEVLVWAFVVIYVELIQDLAKNVYYFGIVQMNGAHYIQMDMMFVIIVLQQIAQQCQVSNMYKIALLLRFLFTFACDVDMVYIAQKQETSQVKTSNTANVLSSKFNSSPS